MIKTKVVKLAVYLPLFIIAYMLVLAGIECAKLFPVNNKLAGEILNAENKIKDIQRRTETLGESHFIYINILNNINKSNAQSEKFITTIRSTNGTSKPTLAIKKNSDQISSSIDSATVKKEPRYRRKYFLRHGMYPEQKLALNKRRAEQIRKYRKQLAASQEEYRQMQMIIAEAWAGPEGEKVRLLDEMNCNYRIYK